MLNPSRHAFPLRPYFRGCVSVGNLPNTAALQEISGGDCCRLAVNAGKAVVVSDSPQNALTILNLSDATTVGTITLTGASANDYEELASCMIDGVARWVVGDFGDNGNVRTSIDLIFFTEIEFTGNHSVTPTVVNCIFPPGNLPTHKDAECLIFDPVDRKIYIIVKRDATQRVYSLPYQTSYTGQQTLTYEGVMTSIPSSTTTPLGATLCYAVGSTISPDATEIVVKGYDKAYLFRRDVRTQTVMQALQTSLFEITAYTGGGSGSPKKSHPSAEPQGETVFYSADGRDLYFASEYLSAEGSSATTFPLLKAERARGVPTRYTFQTGVSPTAGYAGTLDTYIWDTNPNTAYGSDVSMVVDTAVGLESDQRKALLKFDISDIPAGALVVAAYVELYINTEGQGYKFHKMLVPWTESSTYNSLAGGIDNDGTDAAIAADCQNGVNLDTVVATVRNNMNASGMATVQSWITNPGANYGWMIEQITSATGDGVQFDTCQSVTASRRPKLVVDVILP